MQTGAPKPLTPEQKQYQEVITAFKNRAFESCISAAREFLAEFPESPAKDPVLIRMGEAYEGLLEQHYYEPIREGATEADARRAFLAAFGSYACWETHEGRLVYDKSAFQRLLDEEPDSNYADEALYNLIVWDRDHQEPQDIRREIKDLQKVITLYPTSTLQGKILFQIGYRYHLLFEIHRYSDDPVVRNEAEAQAAYNQAEYSYKLCLNTAHSAEYADKAFHYLEKLQRGERISGERD
jgi:hypothetical protein